MATSTSLRRFFVDCRGGGDTCHQVERAGIGVDVGGRRINNDIIIIIIIDGGTGRFFVVGRCCFFCFYCFLCFVFVVCVRW